MLDLSAALKKINNTGTTSIGMKLGEVVATLPTHVQYMVQGRLRARGYDPNELYNREFIEVIDILNEALGAHNVELILRIAETRIANLRRELSS